MSVEITGIDRTLIEWLLRNANPHLDRSPRAALDKAINHFQTTRRVGNYVAEGGVSAVFGLYNHDRLIKTLQTSNLGTIHARIESADETTSWHIGTLTIDRRRHPIPNTLLGGLVGRPLRSIVDADWLPDTARIVEVGENDIHYTMLCDNWVVPINQAQIEITSRSTGT